jgi:hypothetical protein
MRSPVSLLNAKCIEFIPEIGLGKMGDGVVIFC